MPLRLIRSILLPLFLIALDGCAFVTAHQTPRIYEPGEHDLVAGLSWPISFLIEDSGGSGGIEVAEKVMPWLGMRVGVAEEIDLGLRLYGIPGLGVISGDMRCQVATEPLYVSAGLGIALYGTYFGFHPKLLVGSDTVYGGIQYSYYPAWSELAADWELDLPRTALVCGARFGGRLKLMPEVYLYTVRDAGTVVMGLLGIGLDITRGGRGPGY